MTGMQAAGVAQAAAIRVPRDTTERLIGLELLRFGAALGVLVWHYEYFLFAGQVQTPLDWNQLPFRWLFAPFYVYGNQGVELFWCISGFIFTWKYGAAIGRRAVSFRRFVMLRFSRLYPLHFAALLLVSLLQWIYYERYGSAFVYPFNDARHFVLNLFFANWWGFESGNSFNGPSWSVSAEVLIYIVFFWLTRWAGAGWRIDLAAVAVFPAAAAAAKALFHLKLAFTGAGMFFYVGALTFHVYIWIDTQEPRARARLLWALTALVVGSIAAVALHVLKIAAASVTIFPGTLILVQCVLRPENRRARNWLTNLGNLTYASYMIHFPMQLIAMLILGALAIPIESLIYSDWFMLVYLGSVMTAAFFVFHWVERPAQAFLRRRYAGPAR